MPWPRGKSRPGRKWTTEQRKAKSEAMLLKSELHNKRLHRRISDERGGIKAKEWRAIVLKRDDYLCQCCKKRKEGRGFVHAHHIKPWDEFPALRYEISNGVTLCASCHRIVENITQKQTAIRLGFQAGFSKALSLIAEGKSWTLLSNEQENYVEEFMPIKWEFYKEYVERRQNASR